MHPAITHPELRRPVWEALSTLFLDTDVSLSEEYRAKQLAASPFTLEQLEQILVDEVYPVCRSNLLSIAGEWASFDVQWLEARIRSRVTSPFRRMHWVNLGRLTVHLSLAWRATKRRIIELRATPE